MKLKSIAYSVGVAVLAGLILKRISKPKADGGAVLGPTDSTSGSSSNDPFGQVENI